jgi:hypothetical protein
LILAWQVWDRREERLLAQELDNKLFAAPPADLTPYTDFAGRYYLAASALIELPLPADNTKPFLLSELRGALLNGVEPSVATRDTLTGFVRRHAVVFPLIDAGATLPLGEMKASDGRVERVSGRAFDRMDDAFALVTMERLLAGDRDRAAATVVSRLRALRVFDGRLHLGTLQAKSEKAIAIASDMALVLGGLPLSSERIAAIDAALASAFASDELEAALRGHALGSYQFGADRWGPDATASRMGTGLPLRPVWRVAARDSVRALATCLDVAVKPWPARFVEMQKLSEPPPGYMVSHFLGLQFPGSTVGACRLVTENFARGVAIVRATRLALAVERHRARTGQLPEALSALDVDTAEADYVDPFTGQPLLFRKDATGFVVYSVGPNLQDDGGKPTRQMFIQSASAGDNAGSKDVGVAVRLTSRTSNPK